MDPENQKHPLESLKDNKSNPWYAEDDVSLCITCGSIISPLSLDREDCYCTWSYVPCRFCGLELTPFNSTKRDIGREAHDHCFWKEATPYKKSCHKCGFLLTPFSMEDVYQDHINGKWVYFHRDCLFTSPIGHSKNTVR